MDGVRLKHSGIEINYRKIPIDRPLSEDECKLKREGKIFLSLSKAKVLMSFFITLLNPISNPFSL